MSFGRSAVKIRYTVPIMCTTAIGSAESRLWGSETGAGQFLSKPDDSGDAR